jgi:hypothetical protein
MSGGGRLMSLKETRELCAAEPWGRSGSAFRQRNRWLFLLQRHFYHHKHVLLHHK